LLDEGFVTNETEEGAMKSQLAFKSQEGKTVILKFYDSLLANWPLPNDNELKRLSMPTGYDIIKT
jgi:hypothetical protein